ncbi:amidohydrolase family protein [bacterium]|nr:amidohydrolase family protein [bacterium]
MIIGAVNGVSFKGVIIDSHIHYGHFKRVDNPNELAMYDGNHLDSFVKAPLNVSVSGVQQQDNVEKVIVSNLDCLIRDGMKNEIDGNKEMLDFCAQNPKYHPLAVCQPSKTGGNSANINKLLKENPDKFVGLKFHPRDFNLQADNKAYRTYLRLAERYKLPCVFHSDVNLNDDGSVKDVISSPKSIYNAAKEFPDVPVVMAHMGAGKAPISHDEAIEVLETSLKNKDAKLYVDLSWVDWGDDGLAKAEQPSVVKLIKMLQENDATDRVLFGTDAPLGCYGEKLAGGLSPKQAYERTVGTLKTVIKENFSKDADDLIEKIFYKNADDLFFKKEWLNVTEELPHAPSISRIALIAVGAVAGLSAVSYVFNRFFGPREGQDERFNK